MKFDYLVKHNGVYYQIGEDVPIGDNAPVGASKPVEKVTEKVEKIEKPIEEPIEIKEVVPQTQSYTKTEINRMSTAELRELANKNGIDGSEYVGSELKTMLIELLVK